MYNRYIRNDNGTYTRIPQEEDPPPAPERERVRQDGGHMAPEGRDTTPGSRQDPASRPRGPAAGRVTDALTGTLRHALDQLHLEHVDTGDLLILVLLFLLFREDADEELLVALGLLLIL